jgi:hypothetical protein
VNYTMGVCVILAGSLIATESIGVPLEDMWRLHRRYCDRSGQDVLRANIALWPESFHVSATSSGDWTVQQAQQWLQVVTTSAVSETFTLA